MIDFFKQIIGNNTAPIGSVQPNNFCLSAVNQSLDDEGNEKYGFDLEYVFDGGGDTTNIDNEKASSDIILGSLYLARTIIPESSTINEVDYYYVLQFETSEKFRPKWQDMMKEYISGLVGKILTDEDASYSIVFPNGTAFNYDEKAEDDGTDKFICSIVILLVENKVSVLKWNKTKLFYQYAGTSGTLEEEIPILSYVENRSTNIQGQTKVNITENIYYPNDSDFIISITVPLIKNSKFTEKILQYKNLGVNSLMTLRYVDTDYSTDTYTKDFIFSGTSATSTKVGNKIYAITLRRSEVY